MHFEHADLWGSCSLPDPEISALAMALTTAAVTAASRNSGTRRIREDTQGHEQGAYQVQEDTGGTGGTRADTP